jgi:nucleoid DNA-binding protein
MSGIVDVARGAHLKSDVITDVFEEILKQVRAGERVRIKGFGSFEMKTYPGRTLRTPAVNGGKPITFKASKVLKFRQSGLAKKRLNAKVEKPVATEAAVETPKASKPKAKSKSK